MPIIFSMPDPITAAVPAGVLSDDPGVWSVVFEDLFDTFDYNKWGKAGETHPTTGAQWNDLYGQMTGWDPSNVYVQGGNLHLRTTGSGSTWHGGMVHQKGIPGAAWDYGYFEAKIKPPLAMQNAFIAPFWMWTAGNKNFFTDIILEVDVCEEFMNNLPDEGEIIYSTIPVWDQGAATYLHPGNYREIGVDLGENWHTAAVHFRRGCGDDNPPRTHPGQVPEF